MALYNFTEHRSVRDLPNDARFMYAAMADQTALYHEQFSELHRGHNLSSHAKIRHDAELALERASKGAQTRAIILGAGACVDVPVEYVAEHFDLAVVVDAHAAHPARAILQLPGSLQSKIHLVEAELTGVGGEVSSIASGIAGVIPAYEDFVGPASSMLSQVDPEGAAPGLGTGYDLVISHMLDSQMEGGLRVLIDQQIKRAYGRTMSQRLTEPDGMLVGALESLGERVRAAHSNYLAQLVGATGVVHYADSFLMSSAGQIEAAAFEPLDPERFELLAPMVEWEWNLEPGRTFAVVAQTLALRPPDSV